MKSVRTYYISTLVVLILIFLSSKVFASPQFPDLVIYGKDTIVTYNLILEEYLQMQDSIAKEKLFNLSFREGATFNCWRGYRAIYKIDNDSLFLVDIIGCGEQSYRHIDKPASLKKMKMIFGHKLIGERVFIYWFSGAIKFPLNNKIIRWDGVFYAIYEKEKVIEVSNGSVLKLNDVINYVDDPKRINRKNKDKVSDILFAALKKVKWINNDRCDCSDEYFITINEAGDVSNARMLYKPGEIEKYHDKDEYNYCVMTILKALNKLHFDILKDKGKPISEDIFIHIWFTEKGKIENWTH